MWRPPKCKIINIYLDHDEFVPNSDNASEIVVLTLEQLQAIKLKDIDGENCIDGAKKMWISKSTFALLYNKAHANISKALINGYKIKFKC